MKNEIVLDTNILIYLSNTNSDFYTLVNNFVKEPGNKFYITLKSISEFLSVVTRIPKNPLKIDEALEVINGFRNNFSVLYPNEDSLSLFESLIIKYRPKGLRIYDFEHISISLTQGVKKFASFNIKDFVEIEEIELIDLRKYETRV